MQKITIGKIKEGKKGKPRLSAKTDSLVFYSLDARFMLRIGRLKLRAE